MDKDAIALENSALKKRFPALLLQWNKSQNKRQMPWKGEKDPYRIWLSEIILQQTRVEQGLNYYNNFISTFPTIHHLAKASDEKVFKLWEGLGYYSRCRNLLVTARLISTELNGEFPQTFEAIKALKGIGPYTASAISSFAFNLPHAVVDGNVFRVLARVFGITTATDSTAGKKLFTVLAEELLDKKQPGQYNQAIMDFGATVCKPSPECGKCVFQKYCYAYQHDMIGILPVKEKKIKIRKRWFYYLLLEYKGKIAIRQRMEKDIWQQLFEFPLVESEKEIASKEVLKKAMASKWLIKDEYELQSLSPVLKQQLSHQLIAGQFLSIRLKTTPGGWIWVDKKELQQYAFPRFITQYLEEKSSNVLF
jgi:A/G-specific adenine glycosylase